MGDRNLDAKVDDLVAIVGEDDVDKVLADVVHIALDGGEDNAAFSAIVNFLHELLKMGNGGFHCLG